MSFIGKRERKNFQIKKYNNNNHLVKCVVPFNYFKIKKSFVDFYFNLQISKKNENEMSIDPISFSFVCECVLFISKAIISSPSRLPLSLSFFNIRSLVLFSFSKVKLIEFICSCSLFALLTSRKKGKFLCNFCIRSIDRYKKTLRYYNLKRQTK